MPLGAFFHQLLGAQTFRTSRRDFDIDHVADRQARRGDMHRLEPGRLADELAVELAPPFEEQARRPAHRLLVERLLLFVERSEEHTSELQSLMRISYAVFCLKKTID